MLIEVKKFPPPIFSINMDHFMECNITTQKFYYKNVAVKFYEINNKHKVNISNVHVIIIIILNLLIFPQTLLFIGFIRHF